MSTTARRDLFKALHPEAVPNPADDGMTSLLAHRMVCRGCHAITVVRHTVPGDGQKELAHEEAQLLAATTESCDACGAINLSATPTVAEAVAFDAAAQM